MLDLARMGFLRIVPRKGAFVAEYVQQATPETLSAIMGFDSGLIDSALFKDLMEARILIERECTRLACAKLIPASLQTIQAHTEAIYAADDAQAAEAVYLYHKCLIEISGNLAYAMVFQSFEKMIRNLIREHYKNREELRLSIPKFQLLTAAITRRDAYEADMCMHSILGRASDYASVHKELQRSGVTLNLLWLGYCGQCWAAGEIPYQSTQFTKCYADYLAKVNATMPLNHKPGEVMQVDWAGDTAAVIDTDTGEIIPAYVFVATLPYSGYSYVEAFFSMNQETWTTAHVNAYKYFGGVTRIIQCDNLKTGVQKHGKDEVVLNKSYQELAEHYGTAILPARVRAPKDKAAVEGTVGIISTFILAALRNRQFLSLLELNEAIWDRLEMFNHKPFQKREGSRASSFAEERPFLRPLPPRPFELATWKVATVGLNYHISVERMNYSVPFEYIKQKVDARFTKATVEVFYGGNRICSHPRLYGRFNQYSTIQEHMPPEHQKYVQWNGERFIHWAGKAGSNTQVTVQAILCSYKVEQQGYISDFYIYFSLADKHK